jgi:CsoR family transcriptional regulator, copper-sensing transcriptional repressor
MGLDSPDRDGQVVADQQLRDRLRRVEGQVRGIARMIEEGRSCVDVVTQLTAARAALDRVTEQIIASHVDECLTRLPPDEARAAVSRAIRLLAKIER